MNPQTVPVNNPPTPPTSTPIIPIVLGIIFLLFGSGLGYYLGQKSVPKPPPPKISAAERLVEQSKQAWGSLVSDSFAELTIRGQITSITEGNGPTNSDLKGPGKFVNLQSGSSQGTFFIASSSDWLEGDIKDYFSWQRISKSSLKVGDTIQIQTHSPIRDDYSIDSFSAWWVLKQK
ncbi:hypothetical protein A3H85_00580 [Candidatus Daviesbacteria bacterium RIFCSPLOWO2_02_FULL_40_8]|uniref:DUF5666 domain-containing protein n=1 Tax=Candidatus Daviesbacteria bacterium RIFCSPLOWO2_01_FULL_40_24 TaxID=1797787 RepID=A0A1F5MIY8_9BACT|nr:MAG: hypothetical protein A2780_03530 [Candidatus Daviesbacteria bacterium RIFCSPHIGHO2_01_FULL_41_45]OGE35540.1 MAG: hypothetical protein A3C32_02970 [Candidatus Daviesbacteria bacterium RIFCSPHIGHO2_02_FULL_41_14]OGE65289.1 MAG: hypothetical protein A3B49_00305 [Candidatus Daviesbacteria bacterium RIFCSPLOWO2_01_FULL_40_24]OGE66798.1 MAG: hypothetical protein A3H85_00580 [Candidatus Daviesbacteria bacterium RIFCSPLOWO2_02_FULL_40_8]